MNLNETPRGSRLHIGIFGKRNSGKSSLINAITNQPLAVVSPEAGTTTDPVYKSMEINGIGPVALIDTPGLDDVGELGALRVEKTREALSRADIAIFVFTQAPDAELPWIEQIKNSPARFLPVINKTDIIDDMEALSAEILARTGVRPVAVSALKRQGLTELLAAIARSLPEDYEARALTEGLASPGDLVLLVMPQDIQAPKGRLILPQVQTIRELLDKKCLVVCCTLDSMEQALSTMPCPRLIITDSQIVRQVHDKKPEKSLLTTFSVLMAAAKGDIARLIAGARAVTELKAGSRVLIAEACTHAPLSEDIGREQIPAMLRKRFGPGISIDIVSGNDFPADLSGYDLIIHCGACMFNRRYMLSRMAQAEKQGVPVCNYGLFIACVTGILDKISY